MSFSMMKLVDLKRKKWQSKLKDTKRQVLHRCLAIFSRVLSCPKKREKYAKSPRCSEATLAVASTVEETQEWSRENPRCIETTLDVVLQPAQERSRENPTTLDVEIPECLVEEIIHRLRVKSLIRLKSVSKEWKSLIESSSYLAEKHLLRRLLDKKDEMKIIVTCSKSLTLCIKFFSKRSGLESVSRDSEVRLRVAGSCDGLVCVSEWDMVYVYLFNPMTGVTRTLMPPRGTKLSVGFGIDVVTGTYKVVVLYYCFNDRVETVVFDFSTSKWRLRYKTAGPMPLSCIPTSEGNPVYVNGSLFWLLQSDISKILVMDLHTERFRIMSKPNDMGGHFYMWSLEDRLCAGNLRRGLRMYVWVLVQDDELCERWERSTFDLLDCDVPPYCLNYAWFSQTLVSPYHSTCIVGSRPRQSSTCALCQ